MSLRAAYRRTGADVPGGDPRPTHGAEMEGWFWRITDAASGRVAVALCGVNRSASGTWATVAVALHPEGVVRSVAAPVASAAADRYRIDVPGVLHADADHLTVEVDDAALDVRFSELVGWPLRTGGGGVFSVVPWLGQYWHPHVLDGRVDGSGFSGAQLYAEKNWGRGFPEFWWWGQAHGFARRDVMVAFTGGVLEAGPVAAVVGGIVVRLGDRVVRLTPPLARLSADVGGGAWRVRGRQRGVEVVIEGHGDPADAAVLPVPVPAERRNVDSDFEHLVAPVRVAVLERGEVCFEGTSSLAGLELGFRPGHPALATLGPAKARIRSGSLTPRRASRILTPVD